MRSLKTPEECARFPAVSTFQPDAPRRAMVALLKPVAVSKPRAISLDLAAAIRSFLDMDKGFPVRSSSPVYATVMLASFKRFNSCNALNAYKMTTLPPFISLPPGA